MTSHTQSSDLTVIRGKITYFTARYGLQKYDKIYNRTNSLPSLKHAPTKGISFSDGCDSHGILLCTYGCSFSLSSTAVPTTWQIRAGNASHPQSRLCCRILKENGEEAQFLTALADFFLADDFVIISQNFRKRLRGLAYMSTLQCRSSVFWGLFTVVTISVPGLS